METHLHCHKLHILHYQETVLSMDGILVNNQLDAQFFISYIFIPILYMFRAPLCSSSGESIVLTRYLVYVKYVGDRLVCRFRWNCSSIQCINTLRTGDADLRFYVTTVQDG